MSRLEFILYQLRVIPPTIDYILKYEANSPTAQRRISNLREEQRNLVNQLRTEFNIITVI